MQTKWWLVSCLLFLAPSSPQEPQRAARTIVPAVVLTGAKSAIESAAYHRLRDAEELARVWLAHLGEPAPVGEHNWFYNRGGVPEVDFAGYEVLAIFGGDGWNSAGFRIETVTDAATVRQVRFDHRHYQTEGPDGGGKRATPYGFFVLPRTDLPLVLEENVQSMIGRPSEWQERARLPATR